MIKNTDIVIIIANPSIQLCTEFNLSLTDLSIGDVIGKPGENAGGQLRLR
jgi:hypothetical protein